MQISTVLHARKDIFGIFSVGLCAFELRVRLLGDIFLRNPLKNAEKGCIIRLTGDARTDGFRGEVGCDGTLFVKSEEEKR